VSVNRVESKEASVRKIDINESSNLTPVTVPEGKSPMKETEQSPVKT
jgi:hypothetical protein